VQQHIYAEVEVVDKDRGIKVARIMVYTVHGVQEENAILILF